jgi:protein SCO1/2
MRVSTTDYTRPVRTLRARRSVLLASVAASFRIAPVPRALAVLASVSVAGCNRQTGFRAIDITGADFAKGFDLTDHLGRRTRLEDFSGKLLLVFFGYTQCPDVCPTTMAEMAEVMRRLGPLSKQVKVAFITVDPERDTQELLSHYVPAFHPDFVGLWGDAEATARTARAFRIVYQKVPGKTPGSYTVDHSAGSFVFDKRSRVRLMIRHGTQAEAIEADLRRLLDER